VSEVRGAEAVLKPRGPGLGFVTVSDGTVLKLKISIVDIKEMGFSPFGGINFDVKAMGGVSTHAVPEELKKAVADKPISFSPEPPPDGWEILDVKEQEPAALEEIVDTSKGKYRVRVAADVVMVSRNMRYRSHRDEPLYWVSWVWKISWKPLEK
jgi:hypothetical protein